MTDVGSAPSMPRLRLIRLGLAAGLAALLLAVCGLPASADWPSPAGRYIYVISRNGNPIGQQSIEVGIQGDVVTADTDTKIAVTFLGMTVYRMNQHIAETYTGKELTRLVSDTDDDGDVRKVDLTRDGKMLKGTFNGEARAFFCDCMASTMWHAESVAGPVIVEASRARTRRVTVKDMGLETLALPGGQVEARHLSVTGELEREVWYDSQGMLVASVLKGRDGSLIRQELLHRP